MEYLLTLFITILALFLTELDLFRIQPKATALEKVVSFAVFFVGITIIVGVSYLSFITFII